MSKKKLLSIMLIFVLTIAAGVAVSKIRYNMNQEMRAKLDSKYDTKKVSFEDMNILPADDFSKSELGINSMGYSGSAEESETDFRELYTMQFGFDKDMSRYKFVLARASKDGESIKLYPNKGQVEMTNNGTLVQVRCEEVCTKRDLVAVIDPEGNIVESYIQTSIIAEKEE